MPKLAHAKNLRRGRFSQPEQIYLVTTVTHNRDPIFRDLYFSRIVATAIAYRQKHELAYTLAFVLMPDHLHWLFSLGGGKNLSQLMQGFKRHTSQKINRKLLRKAPIWQAGFHDHALRKEEDVKHAARYIVANPLRAKIVHHIGDYPHWDAAWL